MKRVCGRKEKRGKIEEERVRRRNREREERRK